MAHALTARPIDVDYVGDLAEELRWCRDTLHIEEHPRRTT